AMSRILEQSKRVRVTRRRSPQLLDDVLVAIIVDVGEGNAVAFVQLTGAGRGGDVDEGSSAVVPQQYIRKQRTVRRAARSEVHVEKAVVVDVAEVGGHRHEDLVEANLRRDVLECSVPEVSVQLERGRIVGESQIRADGLFDGDEVARREDVLVAVVVV